MFINLSRGRYGLSLSELAIIIISTGELHRVSLVVDCDRRFNVGTKFKIAAGDRCNRFGKLFVTITGRDDLAEGGRLSAVTGTLGPTGEAVHITRRGKFYPGYIVHIAVITTDRLPIRLVGVLVTRALPLGLPLPLLNPRYPCYPRSATDDLR